MTARSSPGSTVIETSLTATRLPKCFETFSTCKQTHDTAFRRMMPSTPRGKNNTTTHEDQPDEGHPVFGVARYVIPQHEEDRRADQRSPEAAHAAEHRHDDEIAGLIPAQRARVDEVVEQRIERAGKADEAAGNNPGHPDMPIDRDAEKARPALVFPDRQQACGRTASATETPSGRPRRRKTPAPCSRRLCCWRGCRAVAKPKSSGTRCQADNPSSPPVTSRH